MAKYTPINWDEIKKNKVELPKFANAAERTAYLEELYKDADMMEDDGKILRRESRSYALQDYYASMTDEEKAIYSENARLRAQEPNYQQNHQAAMKKVFDNPEYQANHLAGMKKRENNPEYRAGIIKRDQNLEYQKKRIEAIQKASSKPVSCDGIVYTSLTQAGIALAPDSRLTDSSKAKWVGGQMKKYPDRFFYV